MRFPTLAKQQIHRPIVPLRLYGLSGRWVNIDVLVDTGSDVCLFPESLARRLDLDLLGTKGFFELFSLQYDASQHTFDLAPIGPLPT